MSARDALLPALDVMRSVGGILGLRVYTVTRRVRQWTGERPGIKGTSFIDTDTVLSNRMPDGTQYPPRVRHVTQREIIASNGLFRDKDFVVGRVTPIYTPFGSTTTAGFDNTTIDGPVTNSATEIMWLMTGPDIAPGGEIMDQVQFEGTSLHYTVWLRSTGRRIS